MKKLFHRFICLLLTVCIIPVYQSALAADNQQYLENAILVENGIPRPITKAEYELLLEGVEADIPTLQHWYQGEHELDPSLSDEEFFTADLPIRVGKFADGLYELETI
ncbi:MAG TPA: hypothetical protein H9707_05365 [Candidatus Butyricicoccus avicola]|nr:hypothetical protein [Candidatus Butyricicoccus avicola]